jgi:hypothetical protein
LPPIGSVLPGNGLTGVGFTQQLTLASMIAFKQISIEINFSTNSRNFLAE